MNVAIRNQYQDAADKTAALIPISANGLFAKNIFDRLKFSFATEPLRTVRAFRAVGLNIKDVSDLASIADLSINGYDKRGVTMPDNKVYVFDVEQIVKKILERPEAAAPSLVAKAPITWTI